MTAQPIDGAALLNEVEAFHRRFNVFPSHAAYVAVALWNVHTHLLDAFESTPRLAFLSPEPGSGKTRGAGDLRHAGAHPHGRCQRLPRRPVPGGVRHGVRTADDPVR